MFVEEPRDPDIQHLAFLRWLAERGRLEHRAIGPPRGELVPIGKRRRHRGADWPSVA